MIAVLITLLTLVGPTAFATGETGEAHATLDAGASRGTTGPSKAPLARGTGRVLLASGPTGGGFNTCEGSRATPQCIQAMSQSEGVASPNTTSAPYRGTANPSAAPASSSTAPATAPSTAPSSLSSRPLGIIGSMGAALGLRSNEERARKAEHERLMKESERTLEDLKRQGQEPSTGPGAAREVKPGGSTQADKDEDKKKLGRVYATYTKLNTKTGLYYVGRTSMVIDLTKSLRLQAQGAVDVRDANHHVDESSDPKGPAFLPAVLDQFDVGAAINYENRYTDLAYLRIRGREQQLIDSHGGAQSDSGKPYRTENAVRAVAKDNPRGRLFHEAATATWGQLHPYTGY